MAVSNSSWKKGVSANPGGFPREALTVRRRAAELAGEGLEYLARVMRDEDENTKNRIVAVGLILDRALGKPAQSIQIEDSNGESRNPAKMSRAELEVAIIDATKVMKEGRILNAQNNGETYEG
jgi:hypothetical protein